MHLRVGWQLCFSVAFLLYLYVAALEAFPSQSPHVTRSVDQQPQRTPHWRHPRDVNTSLANTTTTWAVACVYPVNGIYTRMQRILFYAAMAFVFLLRPHEWLVPVGFKFLATYSSAACIHAILLSTLNGVGPDLDILALRAIIFMTTVAGLCYLVHSSWLSGHKTAKLFTSWIFLSFIAQIVISYSTHGVLGNLSDFIVPANCKAGGSCDVDICSNAIVPGIFRSEMDQLVPVALEQRIYYNASSGAVLMDFPNSTTDIHNQVPYSSLSTASDPAHAGAATRLSNLHGSSQGFIAFYTTIAYSSVLCELIFDPPNLGLFCLYG